MPEPLVYLHGEMLPASQAKLAIFDAGIVLGATVTEMVRTFRHQLFRLDDHLRRLARSLKYVRFNVGFTMDEFAAKLIELTAHNVELLEPDDELGLIVFITAGEFPVYAGSAGATARTTPTVCAHTIPMPFELWADKLETGQHLVTPSIRHVPPQCYDPNMKYRSRMHYYLADQEAKLVDPDASALLLDLEGNVTETGGSNFLLVDRGAIVSPTLRNILPGISRDVVIELARDLGFPFIERDIKLFDVVNADEAFTATTPYCLLPVTRINGLPIGDGRPGPVCKRLLAAWSEQVGLDIPRQMIEVARRRREKV